MKTEIQMRKNYLYILFLIFISILFMSIITTTVEAAPSNIFNMSILYRGDNYITWSYSDVDAITSVSYDGIKIVDFDPSAINFTASDLASNSYHTFCAYSFDDFRCLMTNTTFHEEPYNSTFAIIFGYAFFIAAIGCVVIGRWVPIIAWIGVGLACIGIVSMIGVSFWAGFVFMVVVCAGILVALSPE